MITKEELEINRTPAELAQYVSEKFDDIRADADQVKLARIRKGPYKEFIEEVYPLSIFLTHKYGDNGSIRCRAVLGNQGYDAIVETEEGALVEIVELTWPLDGQKQNYQANQLNAKGITDCEVWDMFDDSQRRQAIQRVLDTAGKKSQKVYETDQGSSLVFILDVSPYFGTTQVEYGKELEELKKSLQTIEYRVSSVFLLLLPMRSIETIK